MDVVENLASRGVKGDFKFTNTKSFRLFVEGLRGLRSFEHSPSPKRLKVAEEKLTACVADYPLDILPQFYLGITKVLRSYEGVPDAIRLFENIVSRDIPELRAAAMYNLAAA